MNRSHRTGLAVALGLLAFVAFIVWYRGAPAPLTQDEIEAHVRRAAGLAEPARGFLSSPETLAFLAADDGAPFYVVNLFKLRDPSALDAFGRGVLPIWLAHGAHPVLVAENLSSALGGWERLTLVRYRSRRDWLEIVSDERFLAALPLRFAGADENLRLSVSARILPPPLLVAGALALAPALYWIGRGRRAQPVDSTSGALA